MAHRLVVWSALEWAAYLVYALVECWVCQWADSMVVRKAEAMDVQLVCWMVAK